MDNLVIISKEEVFTDSMVIAESTATIERLNRLCMVENIIERCIMDGISQSHCYKEVYQ